MDDFDLIETPENVELERRLAGIGTRFVAGFVDMLVIAAIWLVIIGLLIGLVFVADLDPAAWTATGGQWLVTWFMAALVVVAFLTYWGYFVLAEMVTNGQSPGKMAMKIRVVRQDGAPITFVDIAIRNLLRVLDAMPPFFYLVAGITMFCTRRAQRLGDLAAGTVLVMEQVPDYSARAGLKAGRASGRPTEAPWHRQASPEALRATGLRPEEYRLLLGFWLRRGELALNAQARILPRILLPVLRRLGQVPPDESMATLLNCLDVLVHKARAAEHEAGLAGRIAGAEAPPPEGPR